jgi:tRNA threonylcarbamoyl adenosine modification protein (Sua5/YciO/YrdC/YwlC family)
MAKVFQIHPDNPQPWDIEHIATSLRAGAVVLYPTDTVYAIGCDLNNKAGIDRVRQIKQMTHDKPLTFLCSSLSNIASYAQVSDRSYRVMRKLIPGPYTFLLPATKLVPRLVMSPKRRTTGIRVPDHPVCQALLQALENPIISTSAHWIPGEEPSQTFYGLPDAKKIGKLSRYELFDCFDKLVDVIVDNGEEPNTSVSTILDFTADDPVVVRRGSGWDAIADWELEPVR